MIATRQSPNQTKKEKENESSINPNALKYRGVSLHNNDKGNSRGVDGKRGPRKSITSKAVHDGDTCKFRLAVFWDSQGHYVQRGAGHTIHCQHMRRLSKDIPLSVRRWGDKVKEDVGKLSKGRITPAHLRNYLRSVHGIVASRQQCRYASKICDGDDERYYYGEQPGADGLLGYLEKHKEDISYCVWQAQQPESEVPAMERTSNVIFQENNLDGERSYTDLTEMCRDVLHEYQKEMEMLRIRKDQNYFIACGWITKKERRLFRLFPHVLKIDVVKGTNQEDRPLLTISIRTSQGRYVVICRILLSHERRISYRWVFCHALPALLGVEYMKFIIVIMTDGDSNEMEELEIAIKLYLSGCHRLRCGWHIVHKGYHRRVPLEGTILKMHRKDYRLFVRALKNWCYTFMRPGYCETKYELRASKCILLSYLHSRHVRRFLDSTKRLMVQEFLVTGVFPHDQHIAHCHRRNLRCYNECTNSSHEGTNFGAKFHSCPVWRNGTLASTAMSLNLQSDIAIDELFRQLSLQIEGRAVWMPGSSSGNGKIGLDELTSFAGDLVKDQWEKRACYNCKRDQLQDHKWHVRLKEEEEVPSTTKALHPVWRRTWEVKLDLISKRLLCQCAHFQRTGYPCRHQAAVIELEVPKSNGFSHRDCSVIWWKRYMFFGHRSEGPLDDCLRFLFGNDIIGPSMPDQYFHNRKEVVAQCPDFPIGEGSSICLNYSAEALNKAIHQFSSIVKSDGQEVFSSAHDDVGLSQESYEAPLYDLCEDIDEIYNFTGRHLPPDDLGIPQENEQFSEDDDSSDIRNDEESPFPLGTGIVADDVMQQAEADVQAELEENEIMRINEFAKQIKEGVSEQLDLLQQYSRSGHYTSGQYDLRDVLKKCMEPLIKFRLQVAEDIAAHSEQNSGQKFVSSNCVNPTKRRRVMGSKWGLSQFNVGDND